MGLDQFAYAVQPHAESSDFYIGWDGDAHTEEQRNTQKQQFIQWRKHPNLQGWMEDLFNRKANEKGYTGEVAAGGINNDSVTMTGVAIDAETGEPLPMNDEIQAIIDGMQTEVNKQLPAFQEQVLAEAMPKRVFNCQPIRLNLSDLEQLETAINRGELPPTSGFFFGDNADEDYKEQDNQFIMMSREAIRLGLDVYYTSWW